MCVKLPFEDLNLSHYPLHLISTYTHKVTIASRVHSDHAHIYKLNIDFFF